MRAWWEVYVAKLALRNGITSVVLRVLILDSSSTTGAGKTGLTNSSAGLIVSTIADNEATATTYTQASSNIEGITTLGTFAAPSSGKCRFKEVDATNLPGLYELQLADARWAVSGAKSIVAGIHGATNAAPVFAEFQLDNAPVDLRAITGNTTGPGNLLSLANAVKTGAVVSDGANTAATFKTDLTELANDYYIGNVLAFVAGTNNEVQARRISAYDGATRFVTVSQAFDATPTAGDSFIITGRIN